MIMVDWTKPLKCTDGREVELADYLPEDSWQSLGFTRCVVEYPKETGPGHWTFILYTREDGTTNQGNENPHYRVVNR